MYICLIITVAQTCFTLMVAINNVSMVCEIELFCFQFMVLGPIGQIGVDVLSGHIRVAVAINAEPDCVIILFHLMAATLVLDRAQKAAHAPR